MVDDLRRHLTEAFGAEYQKRYWAIFEEDRAKAGYADYLSALQRYHVENPRDPRILRLSFPGARGSSCPKASHL